MAFHTAFLLLGVFFLLGLLVPYRSSRWLATKEASDICGHFGLLQEFGRLGKRFAKIGGIIPQAWLITSLYFSNFMKSKRRGHINVA